MHNNGLILWNDYYPKEYLEKLINKNKLYIIEDKGCIIDLFELDDSDDSLMLLIEILKEKNLRV